MNSSTVLLEVELSDVILEIRPSGPLNSIFREPMPATFHSQVSFVPPVRGTFANEA
ncbi:MAG: hypothetical protein ACYCXF_06075 [Thermoleophilia bacterium]